MIDSACLCEQNGKSNESIKGIPYKKLKIGVAKEKWNDEKRVALSPAVTAALIKKGFTVNIEQGAGFEAKFRDADYANAGANLVDAKTALSSDIVLKVRQPHDIDIPLLRDNSTLISFLYPARNKPLIDQLSQKKMNAFGMFTSLINNHHQPSQLYINICSPFFQLWIAFHVSLEHRLIINNTNQIQNLTKKKHYKFDGYYFRCLMH